MQRIGKQVAFTVPEDLDERILEISKRQKVSKSEVYRKMTAMGVELYNDFEKVGAIKMVEVVGETQKVVKNWRMRRQGSLF